MNRVSSRVIFAYFVAGITFLLPLLVLPFIANYLVTSKLLLFFILALGSLFAFVLWAYRRRQQPIAFPTSIALPALVLTLTIVISTIINYQYPTKQLVGMGGAYLGFLLIITLLPNLHDAKAKDRLRNVLNSAGLITAIASIASFFGYGPGLLLNYFSNLQLPGGLAFSLTGAAFFSLQFLSVVVLANLCSGTYLRHSLLAKVSSLLGVAAIILTTWMVLPGKEATFQTLPLKTSLAVARESLMHTKNALIGAGPDAYSNAYNAFKPVWVNGQDYWRFTFEAAFNAPLTLVVSLGVIGLLGYLWLLWRLIAMIRHHWISQLRQPKETRDFFWLVFVGGALIWHWLAPLNVVMLALLGIGVSLILSPSQSTSTPFNRLIQFLTNQWQKRFAPDTRILTNLTLLTLLGLGLWASLMLSNVFASYYFLQQGNLKLAQQDVTTAYQNFLQAKNFAPRLDFVRRNFSIVNMQVAVALSNKTDLDATGQDQVLQLVNQAIREAKAASLIDQNNYLNWLTLAQIYAQLVESTPQAEQEAFNALVKAIALNPNNPEIRLALGQLFLHTNRLTNAVIFLGQAIERKPDMFDAHYLMAQALRAQKQPKAAQEYFLSALELIDTLDERYPLIQQELQELEQIIATEASTSATTTPTADTTTDSATSSAQPNNTNSDAASLSDAIDPQQAEALFQADSPSSLDSLIEN